MNLRPNLDELMEIYVLCLFYAIMIIDFLRITYLNKINKMNFKLTLSSHPGKAVIMREKTDEHEGHVVNWFTIGDASKAQEVTI